MPTIQSRSSKPRVRLSIQAALAISILMILVFALVYFLVQRSLTNQATTSLQNQAKTFATLATKPVGDAYMLYQDSGLDLLKERIRTISELSVIVSAITVHDVRGKVLFSTVGITEPIDQYMSEQFTPSYLNDKQGYLKQVIFPYIEDNSSHRLTMSYEINSTEIKSRIKATQQRILFIGFIVMLFADLLFVFFIEKLLVRPLKDMSNLAASISIGNYTQSVRMERNDEVKDLGDALTNMASQLQQSITKLEKAEKLKSEFLIISSHNLRTPLTVINGYIDILKSYKFDGEVIQHLQKMEAKAAELTNLTNDMLMVAELEGTKQPQFKMQPVNLKNLLDEITMKFQERLHAKSIKYNSKFPKQSFTLNSQPTYIETIVSNIIDNAIKFTPENGVIDLTVVDDESEVKISISDTGAGIDAKEIPELFTKFHRGTSLMQYQYEGVGLGLYMTKLMVDLLGGSISVRSTLGKGTTFTVHLPKS